MVNLPAAVPIKGRSPETTMSCLVSLSLEYRADDVGMSYDPSMFGMKLGDCRALAQARERAAEAGGVAPERMSIGRREGSNGGQRTGGQRLRHAIGTRA